MPVDRSLLPDRSPFDLLDLEVARVDALLSDLVARGDHDPVWQQPTRCAEWTVRDLLGHLRGVEDYHRACVSATVPEFMASTQAHDMDSFNAALVARYADQPVARIFDDWRRLVADYRAVVRERGEDGVVQTAVGEYPSYLQAYYVAGEYATHGDDFLLDNGDYPGRDAWGAAFTRFALLEQERALSVDVQAGVNHVSFDGESYALSDRALAAAGFSRYVGDDLPPELLRALACLA